MDAGMVGSASFGRQSQSGTQIGGPGEEMKQVMNAVRMMSDDDRAQVKEFMDNVMASVEDGTFDSAKAAEEMPDSLKSVLDEFGIDAQEHLEEVAEHKPPEKGKGPQPMGPPPEGVDTQFSQMAQIMSSIQQMSDDDQDATADYIRQIMESIQDGTFDVSELAEDAPEAFKEVLESLGTDIEEHLNDIYDKSKYMESEKESAPYRNPGLSSSLGA